MRLITVGRSIYRILLPGERRQLGTASFTLSELDAALVNGSF
jgi:hypothetical protein